MKHFDGKRFYNPDAPQAPGLLDALRWKLTSRPEPSPRFISDVEPSVPPRRVEGAGLRATLVNHSTVLLQQRDSNILTDPIWSERAGPFSWIGPRRRRKPGVSWEDLPPIDAVLISHNHYDHLDLATLRLLAARGESTFIVPARGARLLRSENIGPAHELDWGESLSLPGFTIHCVPALHFSSRGIYDRNMKLARRVDSAAACVPGSCVAASAALTQGSRFYCQVFSGFTARPPASIMWRAAALRSRRSSQRHHESTLRRHLPARPHSRCDTRLSHAHSHRTKSSHN